MEIKTFEDLIEWTRQLHAHLSRCLKESAKLNNNDRASALLDYLAGHEALLEKTVNEFEKQADPKAMHTRMYDYLNHKPISANADSYTHYASMSFDDIAKEIFNFHDQVMDLYDSLIGKAEIPEAKSLLEDLLAMEEHEAMRLARQVGRMEDL